MTQEQLRERELQQRREELEFQRVRLFVEFARFGFTGTLTAAIVGAALIFALAILSALTTFKIDGWALVAMGVIVLVGAATFVYLSLWHAPNIAAKFGKQFGVGFGPSGQKVDPTVP
jgi:predicted phage tail protein